MSTLKPAVELPVRPYALVTLAPTFAKPSAIASTAEPGAVKAKVLAVHGADDPIAPKGDRDALEEEMRKAGAHWTILAFGGVYHSFTDPTSNRAPNSQFSAHANRYGFMLAHAYIADALAGKV